MRFAYADPPYLGMCSRYGHEHGDGGCWDEPETHRLLIGRLSDEYDGWALSLSSTNLRDILPLCPPDARVLAWCKKWASWKPGIAPAYAWEPVIMRGGRPKKERTEPETPRDWMACHIRTGARFHGAKPDLLVWWLIACLGVQPEDEFADLFPGSGAVTDAYERWRSQQSLGLAVPA